MDYFEKHPMLLVVVAILGCGVAGIFVKFSNAPSALTGAYRLLWTVLLMTPVVLGRGEIRRELARTGRREVLLSCVSGLFLAVHFAIWFESLNHTSVASSTTIVFTEVIWVSLAYCLFLKGRIPSLAWAAIGVTMAGNLLIAWADFGSGSHLWGDILSLIAAMLLAGYTLLGREVRKTVSTTVYTYIVYTSCAAALTVTTLAQGHDFLGYGASPLVSGLLMAVFSTLLGHSIFSWCLKFFSPSFVSATKLCIPVTAAVAAFFVFGEVPTPLQLVGCGVILGGMCWYYRLESRADR